MQLNAFSNAAYDNATLIVPDEAYYDYLQSYGWDMFENTKPAAIEDVFAETTTVADIFNLLGIIVPLKRIYILSRQVYIS